MKTKFINKEVPESILEIVEELKQVDVLCHTAYVPAEYIEKLTEWFDSLEDKEAETKDEPSVQYEFEVGDLVEVQEHPSGDNTKWEGTEGFDNSWVSQMNKFVGNEFTVDTVRSNGVYLVMNYEGYRFPSQSLKLISKAKK